MNKPGQQAHPPLNTKARLVFHLEMALVYLAVSVFSIVGCCVTSIRVPNLFAMVLVCVVLIIIVMPLALWYNEKGKFDLCDAALTIPWAIALLMLLPFPLAVVARLSMHRELQDAQLTRIDQYLNAGVPSIIAWASSHRVLSFASECYRLSLLPFLVAYLLPALMGRAKSAQRFVRVNVVAFVVGIALFAWFPAIGPWYGYHFAPTAMQADCQAGVFAVRLPGIYILHLFGIVCFPSFHVIWAVLGANSLWEFRFLRVPAIIASGLVLYSTMTTGWHYFSDVIGGVAVAAVAILVVKALNRFHCRFELGQVCSESGKDSEV